MNNSNQAKKSRQGVEEEEARETIEKVVAVVMNDAASNATVPAENTAEA